jgi:hypothetical protein
VRSGEYLELRGDSDGSALHGGPLAVPITVYVRKRVLGHCGDLYPLCAQGVSLAEFTLNPWFVLPEYAAACSECSIGGLFLSAPSFAAAPARPKATALASMWRG